LLVFLSNTMVGDIALRGRLPASTRLAIGPLASRESNEKSVSWLLRMKPSTIWREPNASSTLVVIDRPAPYWSTATMCEVEWASIELSRPQFQAVSTPGGWPAGAVPIERSGLT